MRCTICVELFFVSEWTFLSCIITVIDGQSRANSFICVLFDIAYLSRYATCAVHFVIMMNILAVIAFEISALD